MVRGRPDQTHNFYSVRILLFYAIQATCPRGFTLVLVPFHKTPAISIGASVYNVVVYLTHMHTPKGALHPAITYQPTATIDELVNYVGIDKDLLNQPCSAEHLTKIAPYVSSWPKYALVLGLNQPQIDSIKSDQLLAPEMKAQPVLSLWKQANGFRATYLALVDVCLQNKDVQLAGDICNIVKG